MLEVVWIALSIGGFVMGAAALWFATRGSDLDREVLAALKSKQSREEELGNQIAELEARADANCENVRNQGEILAEHREALDAIAERLPKPRTPRKRKGNALKAAVDAVVALDADS